MECFQPLPQGTYPLKDPLIGPIHPMKVEYTDVSVTEKSLVVEIPTEVVEEEIQRVTHGYARTLKLPGFRPGKVPAKVVRQRFMPQILQDVAEDLIPRAVDDVLRERGVEPVDTPNVKDVSIDEHQPLKFTAAIATAPPVDPGPLDAIQLRKPPVSVPDEEVTSTVERLRSGRARFEPVEGRGAQHGETVVADMTRRKLAKDGEEAVEPEELQGVSIEIGAEGNPPGFDAEVTGLAAGDAKTFTVAFPAEYPVESLAGASVQYALTVTGVKSKVLPGLDDEFAKDLGYDSLDALRTFVKERLTREAERNQDRDLRQDLLKQLARRVEGGAPESLVRREVDRLGQVAGGPARGGGRDREVRAGARRAVAAGTHRGVGRRRRRRDRAAGRAAQPARRERSQAPREGPRHRPDLHGAAPGEDD
jgi:trigger factor